jgi:NAD(P)-dependent dehydrogenase (short-subunit alcohol dehydrogenase family)
MNSAKVALVTGGGTGIGKAIARALAADGFQVAVAGRRIEPLREVCASTGGKAYRCDIASSEEIDALVTAVLADFGRLDSLVNSAGIVKIAPIEAASLADIEMVVRTNLLGTILMTQRCAPALREARGAIVNIGSTLAHYPQPGQSAYIATKGGIEAFTRAMAVELASDGVRVNAVCPAFVRSDMLVNGAGIEQQAYDALVEANAAHYLLGRVGEPEDVAGLVVFLASNRATWITGQTILVDGGRVLGPPPIPSRHVAERWTIEEAAGAGTVG